MGPTAHSGLWASPIEEPCVDLLPILNSDSNFTPDSNKSRISTDYCDETNYSVDDSYTFGFIIFGLLVCGFGIFTNFFVIFVLIRYANLAKKPTNVYLLSLSISDMLGVLCGPPLLLQAWFLRWPFVEDRFSQVLFKG